MEHEQPALIPMDPAPAPRIDDPVHEAPRLDRRGFPFIWVTWLSGLLSGDMQCWWRVWVKTHFRKYPVRPDPEQGSLDKWKAEHAQFARAYADQLRAEGAYVTVEDQNETKVRGRFAILMGKPDIIVHGETDERVDDLKGGDPRGSDVFQVRIYGYMRRLLHADRGTPKDVTGRVAYRDHVVDVSAQDIADTRALLSEAIIRLTNGPEPEPVPSAFECGRCDIGHCTKRYVEQPAIPTEDF